LLTFNRVEREQMTEVSDYLNQEKFAVWYGELTRGRAFGVPTLRTWRQQRIGPPWIRVGKDPIYSMSGAKAYLRSLEKEARK
jgi:hypothetical protein